jgi:hypothetical protein
MYLVELVVSDPIVALDQALPLVVGEPQPIDDLGDEAQLVQRGSTEVDMLAAGYRDENRVVTLRYEVTSADGIDLASSTEPLVTLLREVEQHASQWGSTGQVFPALTPGSRSAPDRTRTCAHGSGGRRPLPAKCLVRGRSTAHGRGWSLTGPPSTLPPADLRSSSQSPVARIHPATGVEASCVRAGYIRWSSGGRGGSSFWASTSRPSL